MSRPARYAVLTSRDQTPAPSPYRVSLAISIASSYSSKPVTATTGPKFYSWKMRILLCPWKIVGAT